MGETVHETGETDKSCMDVNNVNGDGDVEVHAGAVGSNTRAGIVTSDYVLPQVTEVDPSGAGPIRGTCVDDTEYVPPLVHRTGTPIMDLVSVSCDCYIRSVPSDDQVHGANNATHRDLHEIEKDGFQQMPSRPLRGVRAQGKYSWTTHWLTAIPRTI